MNRILVPFDFSQAADHAVDFAAQIASKAGAREVTLFNVIEHPSESRLKYMGASPADSMENVFMTRLIELTEQKLDETLSNLIHPGVNFTYRIQLGNPYQRLGDEVAEEDVTLVVMGTMGADGIDELFVGSNAEQVVRRAQCPVITLKNPASIDDINDLVFASNFHDLKDGFVEKVKELQRFMSAKLRIVKINTPANFTTQRHDLRLMKDFVKKYGIDDYTLDIYNYTNEEDGIVLYAEDINADMIALGTNQRHGFNHFLTGSIAEDVVNHAHRPVWTFLL